VFGDLRSSLAVIASSCRHHAGGGPEHRTVWFPREELRLLASAPLPSSLRARSPGHQNSRFWPGNQTVRCS